jgi:hypothetical protein
MDTFFFKSVVVGILVTLALYLTLSKTFDLDNYYIRRTLGLFSGGVGLLTAFWLFENPNMLEKYTNEIVISGIGVVLALLVLARKAAK